jgi:hypothetical protein
MFCMRQSDQSSRGRKILVILTAVVLSALTVGCTSVRMTMTPRSIMEQQLLVLAIERAVSQFDTQKLTGKRVTMELYGLAEDDLPFARELVKVWLWKNGVKVVQDKEEADIRLKGFAKVLAVDQAETLFGTPQFSLLGIPIPAIAIYRNLRNRGLAEIQIYAIDDGEEVLVGEVAEGIGKAKHDRFTILFVFSWTSSDLDKKLKQMDQ